MNKYSKALDKKFKDKPLPTAVYDALTSNPSLTNRAIAMHLFREGQFSVAETFVAEATRDPPHPTPTKGNPNPDATEGWEQDLAAGTFNSKELQSQFSDMYRILHELRQNRNLEPAIRWAGDHSELLETRGSNLEFELCKLRYISIFNGQDVDDPMDEDSEDTHARRAWAYARSAFAPFQQRYSNEVQELLGALAFAQNIYDSPYRRLFYRDSAWEEVANSFTREFCSLLGLSADSPLYIAATAGAIALPTLLKLQNIMKEKRTNWTTQTELPVHFSVFFHPFTPVPVTIC